MTISHANDGQNELNKQLEVIGAVNMNAVSGLSIIGRKFLSSPQKAVAVYIAAFAWLLHIALSLFSEQWQPGVPSAIIFL